MSISHSSGVNFLRTHTHVINRNNPPGVAPWIPPPIGPSALGYLAVLYVRGGGRNIWCHYRLKLSVHFIFDQLCTFHSFPLHSSVLKPDLYLYQNQQHVQLILFWLILCKFYCNNILTFLNNQYIIKKNFDVCNEIYDYIVKEALWSSNYPSELPLIWRLLWLINL